METPITTRDLDRQTDWRFFHDVAPVSEADRGAISALDTGSCRTVWKTIVACNAPATVVASEGWMLKLLQSGKQFEWQDAWNDEDDNWARQVLCPLVDWSGDTAVLFIWGPGSAVRTRFDVFVRCWRAFLFDDEGPVLLSLEHPEVMWFGPTGTGRIGRRPLN